MEIPFIALHRSIAGDSIQNRLELPVQCEEEVHHKFVAKAMHLLAQKKCPTNDASPRFQKHPSNCLTFNFSKLSIHYEVGSVFDKTEMERFSLYRKFLSRLKRKLSHPFPVVVAEPEAAQNFFGLN